MVFPMRDGSSGEGTPMAHARLTRRAILCGTGAALGLSLTGNRARHVAAHGDSATTGEVANVAFPPDVGQADLRVYVPETGHTLRGSFLDYWRATGAATVFGNPVSEPFAAANGYYSQAFENVVFQYRPEFFDTHDPIMRPMPIGRMALQSLDTADGGGRAVKRYRLLARAQRPLRPEDDDVLRAIDAGGLYDETTGHTVSGEILAWYRFNEGSFYLGSPLTEPHDEGGGAVQYFEGGLLVTGENGVGLAPLAKKLGPQLGIDTLPVEQADLPPYDETLFWTADNPNLVGDPDALGPKWVEVSISLQMLWVYQGQTVISSTRVSTGLEPNGTEEGLFHVRLKYAKQDMQGFTDATGEVLGFGEARPGTIPYEVKDVPHVMYFNMEAEAFHGAYWHGNFGQAMSHGCINLPIGFADWLYGWTPLGAAVWVHA
jgi:lipoprotein-anchoring transpeptidase ErfK/SrfK